MPKGKGYGKRNYPGASSKPGKKLIKAGGGPGGKARRPGGPVKRPSAKPKVIDH